MDTTTATPVTVGGFTPSPDVVAQAESLQRQALDLSLPHSQRMKLVNEALALRQGRAPVQAIPVQAPTAAPVPAPVEPQAGLRTNDPTAQVAAQFDLTPAELAAAQSES